MVVVQLHAVGCALTLNHPAKELVMRFTLRRTLYLPLVITAAVATACTSGVVSVFEREPEAGADLNSADGSTSDTARGAFGEGGEVPDVSVPSSAVLIATVRDFKLYNANDPSTNPDFENVPPGAGPWDDRDIAAAALGTDGKPAYKNPAGRTLTTHGRASFDSWYRDVPGMNVSVPYPMPLLPNAGGSFAFDSNVNGVPLSSADPRKMFFPIDDGTPLATAFGNQGDPHNYSFTVELHTAFTYKGGELFSFRGDDDVFVYIDNILVINVGGIHEPEQAAVQLDTLQLTKGKEYRLDFFSAERHKIESNILFTTTLGLRPAPPR